MSKVEKCFVCQSPIFSGWVENPMYCDMGNNSDEEIVIEMNISYCVTCNIVSNSDIKIRAIDVEHETYKKIEEL